MATASLIATPRTDVGKGAARKLRAAKQVPAVIYGHNREPQPLALDTRELERMLDRIAAESTVIELTMDGAVSRTLIREIQRHPFKREILHVDFQELVAGETITVSIPLTLVGVPNGVRNEGGTLDQIMRDLLIEVDPANMPSHIDVDVTGLELNTSIHVRDLKLPEGVSVLVDEDATVCVVAPPRVETAVAAPTEEAAAGAEPEVIRKAKEEGEGDEK